MEEWLRSIRREIHRSPGLDFDLEPTARTVERELLSLGIKGKRYAKTGIGALVEGSGEASVLIRADMDGLPMDEKTGKPYASAIPGRMHSCGHDFHTACLLGAARILKSLGSGLPGRVLLVFQPAEETTGGARPMIEQGLLRGLKPAAALALHVNPELKAGVIGINPGKALAASRMFDIVIKGRSSHGARPHEGVDALTSACQTVTALQNIVSRMADPTEPAVITVGTIHGGESRNVLASSVKLEGIIRTGDADLMDRLEKEVRAVAAHVPKALGAEGKIKVTKSYPALINNPAVCSAVASCAEELLGCGAAVCVRQSMGVDDFAYFAELFPSCYFNLGTAGKDGPGAPLHSPFFDPDERALPIGAKILAMAAQKILKDGVKGSPAVGEGRRAEAPGEFKGVVL